MHLELLGKFLEEHIINNICQDQENDFLQCNAKFPTLYHNTNHAFWLKPGKNCFFLVHSANFWSNG